MPGLQAGHQHNPFVNTEHHTLLEGPVENPKKNILYILWMAQTMYSIVSLKEHMNENFWLCFFLIIQTYIYRQKKGFE